MVSAARPARRATVADLAALPDERRGEIIDGELVEKAAPGAEHGIAQLGLGAQLFFVRAEPFDAIELNVGILFGDDAP